jgi:7-cyano-7-deazaguanine synthase
MEEVEGRANALVLLSGGIDSAVSLYWARSQGWDLATIEFEYYLRPDRERQSCRRLRDHAGIRNAISVPLDFIREVADLPPGVAAGAALRGSPEGYIPSRNLNFYSLAAYDAEQGGRNFIVGGHNRTDSQSFSDAGGILFSRLNELLRLSMWSCQKILTRIVMPLIDMDKIQVIGLGRSLGVPFELTWSCYHDAEIPCGNCESCLERRNAFDRVQAPVICRSVAGGAR